MISSSSFPALAFLSALVCCTVCQAQDTQPLSPTNRSILQAREEAQVSPGGGFKKDDLLLGDVSGTRNRLYDSGVEVFGFYSAIFSGNIRGGRDSGHATYVDDTWVGLKLNLEKLVGWRGGQFVISGINRHGDDLTNEYIGSLYSTQQMVGGQRVFLYQLYLQQKLFVDQLTAKIGRFGASDDFNTSPFYGYSLNNGINGNIRNVLFNTRFSAYPFATWAGAIIWNPAPLLEGKVGVFQVSEGMFENDDNGLNFGFGEGDGYTAIAQIGFAPELFKRPVEGPSSGFGKDDAKTAHAPKMQGLPGHYWIGATYSDWDEYRRFGGGKKDTSYGFYAHADQMVYREAPGKEQGLFAWAASAYYPQDEISIVPFQINFGLNYKGLIPTRDEDRTILHFIYGDISRDYARTTRVLGGRRAESEKVLEAAYRIQLAPFSYFQPDVQYVMDPGGTGDIPNAVVIGVQFGLTF